MGPRGKLPREKKKSWFEKNRIRRPVQKQKNPNLRKFAKSKKWAKKLHKYGA